MLPYELQLCEHVLLVCALLYALYQALVRRPQSELLRCIHQQVAAQAGPSNVFGWPTVQPAPAPTMAVEGLGEGEVRAARLPSFGRLRRLASPCEPGGGSTAGCCRWSPTVTGAAPFTASSWEKACSSTCTTPKQVGAHAGHSTAAVQAVERRGLRVVVAINHPAERCTGGGSGSSHPPAGHASAGLPQAIGAAATCTTATSTMWCSAAGPGCACWCAQQKNVPPQLHLAP